MQRGRVVMGLLFFPRGGSAYVVRYLAPALQRAGWTAAVVSGSLGPAGHGTHAATFFDGLDVHVVDATEAERLHARGGDAIAAPHPMHPSYEDRAGAPDVVFAAVAPALAEHLAAVWDEPFTAAGASDAAVFHLHHLTPQLDLVRRCWPATPRLAHLHGTELKLLAAIEERVALARTLGHTLASMPASMPAAVEHDLDAAQVELLRSTRWDFWRHGSFWADHLREQARSCDHLVAVSPQNRLTALAAFDLEPDDVTAVPNGVDIEHFRPRDGRGTRAQLFHRVLVEDPQGWAEGGSAGSVRYTDADVDRLLGPDGDATVLLYVGRFLHFKRVPLLVRAFAAARDRFERPASLVIWGGHAGEWEGEHPVTVAQQVGAEGIFFAGWRGHEDLPAGLAACDVLVVPSVEDPYPQVPLEAMAAGLPVVASASGGLLSMVNLDEGRPTGWLVPPDDAGALTEVIVDIVNDPGQLAERAANALAHARADLSWDGLVSTFEAAYERAVRGAERRTGR